MIGKLFGFAFFIFGLTGIFAVVPELLKLGNILNIFDHFGIAQPTLSNTALDVFMWMGMFIVGILLLRHKKKDKK